jgi:hypothetical protein
MEHQSGEKCSFLSVLNEVQLWHSLLLFPHLTDIFRILFHMVQIIVGDVAHHLSDIPPKVKVMWHYVWGEYSDQGFQAYVTICISQKRA